MSEPIRAGAPVEAIEVLERWFGDKGEEGRKFYGAIAGEIIAASVICTPACLRDLSALFNWRADVECQESNKELAIKAFEAVRLRIG